MNYNLLVHVDLLDPARLRFALTNIENYYNGLPGKKFSVSMVANGAAVTLFKKDTCQDAATIQALAAKGVVFRLCQNALTKFNVQADELLDCVTIVPAGMVALVELQNEGYAYVKP